MRHGYYRLDEDHNIIACKDAMEWARSFDKMDRHVKDTVTKDFRVSTVFIGLDLNFIDDGPMQLFETMVFCVPDPEDKGTFTGADCYCERYATYEEASLGHDRVFNMVINGEIELKKSLKLNFKLNKNEETSTG